MVRIHPELFRPSRNQRPPLSGGPHTQWLRLRAARRRVLALRSDVADTVGLILEDAVGAPAAALALIFRGRLRSRGGARGDELLRSPDGWLSAAEEVPVLETWRILGSPPADRE